MLQFQIENLFLLSYISKERANIGQTKNQIKKPNAEDKMLLGLNSLLKNSSDSLHSTSGYKKSDLSAIKLLKLKLYNINRS
jgi:hypothetical protein